MSISSATEPFLGSERICLVFYSHANVYDVKEPVTPAIEEQRSKLLEDLRGLGVTPADPNEMERRGQPFAAKDETDSAPLAQARRQQISEARPSEIGGTSDEMMAAGSSDGAALGQQGAASVADAEYLEFEERRADPCVVWDSLGGMPPDEEENYLAWLMSAARSQHNEKMKQLQLESQRRRRLELQMQPEHEHTDVPRHKEDANKMLPIMDIDMIHGDGSERKVAAGYASGSVSISASEVNDKKEKTNVTRDPEPVSDPVAANAGTIGACPARAGAVGERTEDGGPRRSNPQNTSQHQQQRVMSDDVDEDNVIVLSDSDSSNRDGD